MVNLISLFREEIGLENFGMKDKSIYIKNTKTS